MLSGYCGEFKQLNKGRAGRMQLRCLLVPVDQLKEILKVQIYVALYEN